MSDYRFRGEPIDTLSREELLVLIRWLMDRLERHRASMDIPDFFKDLF